MLTLTSLNDLRVQKISSSSNGYPLSKQLVHGHIYRISHQKPPHRKIVSLFEVLGEQTRNDGFTI